MPGRAFPGLCCPCEADVLAKVATDDEAMHRAAKAAVGLQAFF